MKTLDQFFFTARPTEGIALFRILFMALTFCYFLIDIGNLQDFYGPHAILSMDTVKEQFPFIHLNLFKFFRPNYEVAMFIFILYGLAIFMAMIGLFTRASLITVLICMTSLHQRNIWLLCSSEILMRIMTIYLVFSPCGHSISVDSFLSRYLHQYRMPKDWALWSMRLIQIQLSAVYVWTVSHKLKGEDWIDGSSVYYATRLESLKNFTIPFILDSILCLKLATWGTLLIEFALGTFIWIPRLRRPMIIIGLIFHLMIEITMSIPFFEMYMMIYLLSFLKPEEVRAFIIQVQNRFLISIEHSRMVQELKTRILMKQRG